MVKMKRNWALAIAVTYLATNFSYSFANTSKYESEEIWTKKSTLTSSEKKNILTQVVSLQDALKRQNRTAIEKYLTKKDVVPNLSDLHVISRLTIKPENLTVTPYRKINSTKAQEKRRYYAYPNAGDEELLHSYYYLEGKKKVPIEDICDDVTQARWISDVLLISQATEPNKLTPKVLSCNETRNYMFKLVNGKLKLVYSIYLP